jgi:integrase
VEYLGYRPEVLHCVALDSQALKQAGLRRAVLPAEMKALISGRSFTPIAEVLAFLRKKCVGQIGIPRLKERPNSVEAYAYDLCDFYNYLDHCKTELPGATPALLRNYVGSMYEVVSPVTGKVYALQTIKRRLSTARQFLGFCQNKGWLKNRFEVGFRRVRGQDVEVLEPNIDQELTQSIDSYVKHIPPADLQLLMAEIGPWIEEVGGIPTIGPRDRLIAELGFQCGLRRVEPLGLKTSDFLEAQTIGVDACSRVEVRVLGKGGKWRSVPIPVWLVRAIVNYIRNERQAGIDRRTIEDPGFKDHGFVFVHGEAARGKWGDVLRKRQVTRLFAAARARARAKALGNGDVPQAMRIAQIQFHSLRHTFALVTYVTRRADGDPAPGRYVQAVLGHAWQSTTDSLYLQASLIRQAAILEFAQAQLMKLMGGTHG